MGQTVKNHAGNNKEHLARLRHCYVKKRFFQLSRHQSNPSLRTLPPHGKLPGGSSDGCC